MSKPRWISKPVFMSVAILGLLLSVGLGFQNCSSPVAFDTTLDSDNILLDDRCTNEFSCFDGEIVPEESINKPEVKVVMVIDNSYTMSQMQEKLAQGASRLLDGLKGFSASFSIYTTTHELGEGGVPGRSPLGFDYEKSVLTQSKSCRRLLNGNLNLFEDCSSAGPNPLGSQFFEFSRSNLAPPLVDSEQLSIKEATNGLQFEDVRRRLASEIRSVGIQGYPEERGICSLVKAVYEEGENRPFKSKEGLGVFVVISDEDDESTPESCVSYEEKKTDCTEQDPTTRPVTRTEECREPECTSYRVPYTVNLGPVTNLRTRREYVRETFRRSFTYQTQSARTFNHSLAYKYSILEDGVTVLFDEARSFNNSAESCAATCSPAQLNAIQSTLAGQGALIVAGSCLVTSCSANPQPAPSTVTRNLDSLTACSQTLSQSACEAAVPNDARPNLVAGSCQINQASCTLHRENRATGYSVVQSCTPRECTGSELSSGLSGISNPWRLRADSCRFTCSNENVPAGSSSQVITQQPDSVGEFTNYCENPVPGNNQGRNVIQIAESTSNWRRATSCVQGTPQPVYQTRTITEQVLANPGQPKCKAEERVWYSYPLDKKIEDQPDLIEAFNSKAKERFGANYFVSAIVHNASNRPSCPIEEGQKLGQRYMKLVEKSPSGGNVASICDTDYGQAAFDGVNRWVETTMKNTYLAEFDSANTEIISLWLLRDGVRQPLDSSKFQVQGRSVTILDQDLLKLGDRLIYRARSR